MRPREVHKFEKASGLLIAVAILLGFAAANSPLSALYQAVHHAPLHVGIGSIEINEPLIQWINEGLLVLFFVLVGLEIKRELLEGHLATPRRAALPAVAAFGGMVAPAAIYVSLNWSNADAIQGWAIPTATDIVLVIGLLALLGSRVPVGLKVFLTALAIFDDIGAVLIIALFYGGELSFAPLILGGFGAASLFALNRFQVAHPATYIIAGLILWASMLKAGLEPALAGVLIALAVPLRMSDHLRSSPLKETERRLYPWGALVVVPLFAFFNAGVVIDGEAVSRIFGPVSLGVLGGLFLGKQFGVFAATWMAVRLGIGQLPEGVNWRQVYGAALFAGVGFTMSLFITSLAFSDARLIASAKLAILGGSLLSAIAGSLVISWKWRRN